MRSERKTRNSRKRNCMYLRKGDESKRGTEYEMNEELEVRESSLSYVIGSMNNNSTRKSGGK